MKALFIEEQAVRYLSQRSSFQSGEFEDAVQLIQFVRNGSNIRIGEICCSNVKEIGFILKTKVSNTSKALIIDFNKMPELLNYDDNSLVTIILKIVKFSLKHWETIALSDSERYIGNNHAILFPFPYSEKHPIKVLVNLSPDTNYTSKRGMNYLYASRIGEGQFELQSNDLLNLKTIKHEADIIFEKEKKDTTNDYSNIESLQVNTLEPMAHTKAGFMDYEKWSHYLSNKQKEFVCKPLCGSERLEGAAGTGKTTTLVLRAVYLCRQAAIEGKELHILFICHSVASRELLQLMISSAANDASILQREYSPQSITLSTLQDWCTNYLGNKIGRSEVLDEDAQESKDLQFKFLEDVYGQCMKNDFPSYKDKCSEEYIQFIENSDKNYVIGKLVSEISISIKGRASQNLDTYKILPRLQDSIPMVTEYDKLFTFLIYEKYQQTLEELGYFDNDDISLSSHAQLETPIWRRRRSELGYDVVVIDETHLFSYNELSIFHLLTKDEKNSQIIYAVDKSQAVGDRGVTKEVLQDHVQIHDDVNVKYNTIFRSSPQIIELAFSILSSGAELFLNFENPLDKILPSFNIQEEKKSQKPVYKLVPSDEEMIESVFSEVDRLSEKLSCTRNNILITCTDRELQEKLIKYAQNANKPIETLVRRGDYKTIMDAEKHNRYVVGYIDYVGGLEFCAVVIVGVDKGRVPPISSLENKIYQNYEWHNRMYVAITRAKYAVVLIGNKTRTVSNLLQKAIQNDKVIVIE